MARRVFLHVGTPKSGTTYLQAVLWQNAARLKADGLLLPGRFQTHYAAAKGVTSRLGQRRETRVGVDEAWPRLVAQVNRWRDDALISHELLAPAYREQALTAKAAIVGAELHLVLTARALHRQLPASWQEQVKGGLSTPYDVFLTQVRDEKAKGAWFWEVQDLLDIVRRWGDGIAPSRVHVVTVPPDRSDPALLWRRYAGVLGLDPASYDVDVPVKNVSLGPVESELLRRVHLARDERFTDAARHRWTRRLLASDILGQRRGERIALPDQARAWLAARTTTMLGTIRDQGYDVVGDLTELETDPTTESARSMASVTASDLAEAQARAITRLREHLASRRPSTPPPAVGPDDGVAGILELLEHIRAADTGTSPRPAAADQITTVSRLRRSLLSRDR
ncbi:MAG: hypothetical protein H0V07_03910 [Propionibacteriales bacterium]|nr:hypothetical protein [Propionibacteriales bacterium]